MDVGGLLSASVASRGGGSQAAVAGSNRWWRSLVAVVGGGSWWWFSSRLAVLVVDGFALRASVLRGVSLCLCVYVLSTVVTRRYLLLVVALGCSVLRVVWRHPRLVIFLAAWGGKVVFGGVCCCFAHVL